MDTIDLFHRSDLEGGAPQHGLVYAPDAFSLIVAVLAGIAGTLSLTSAKPGALVGVAISVTTVPAAANAAVALAYGDTSQTLGSSVQLLVNLGGIVLAGTLTLLAQKYFWKRQRERA